MNSIFRNKKKNNSESEFQTNKNFDKLTVNAVTHDNGVPRARKYSLSCELHFTQYSGFTIKKLIETNFNYFTWLPRNIQNFEYEKTVLDYAKTCLEQLEKIDNYSIGLTQTKLGKAVNQVNAMISYEQALDTDKNKYTLVARKSLVDVEYYKKIIDTPIERLIRQSFKTDVNASKNRRKYFEELNKIEIKKDSNQ
ncbi:hypothetical protein [uncultured Winogradskyella sp.]|uniref:hypothetical protein n=1 Tax=uncultured Winogradskyella sp. TaxID=395353 RepID=UPI002625B925|nr:hypothetical protein [uncultured Winogradskyella sp.]|tara:strand:+ start:679 stop:1263 length:585 start_codon:yes stop_codon:yes gene_type:complete